MCKLTPFTPVVPRQSPRRDAPFRSTRSPGTPHALSTALGRPRIVWTYHGDGTAREIADANDEFSSDDRSERIRYPIIDGRDVSSVEWSDRDIAMTAGYDIGAERSIKNVNVACVAVNADIVAKLEKFIAISRTLNSSWQYRGFESLPDAREWASI